MSLLEQRLDLGRLERLVDQQLLGEEPQGVLLALDDGAGAIVGWLAHILRGCE